MAILLNDTTFLWMAILLLISLLIIFFVILWYLIRVMRVDREVAGVLPRSAAEGSSPTGMPDEVVSGGGVCPAPASSIPECHHEIDILKADSDIRENMNALKQKYRLDSITLASEDGLVIASSDQEGGRIAAENSQIMKKMQKPEDDRVHLFRMYYRGSPLIVVIRAEKPLSPVWLSSIEDDARKILNWWL